MSRTAAIRFGCAGCGWSPPPDACLPFACARAACGDDVDHVLARRLETANLRFPNGGSGNPFLRYRELQASWHEARARGIADADYVAAVERLDRAVASVDGRGFAVTSFAREPALSDALGFAPGGGVWVKDETRNVAGSHKARHLMGIAIALEVRERVAAVRGEARAAPRLAIASCGNAALAAAVVARAADWALDVFIPTDAEAAVVERLRALGARLAVCPRVPGERGDPCVAAFHRAVEAGALPFACQGNENGLTIDGGETLGFEVVESLGPEGPLDRWFVQVGGGALASACHRAFSEARQLGARRGVPRLHAVQTRGAWPLARAYGLVAERVAMALRLPAELDEAQRAERIRARAGDPAVRDALGFAATHRSRFMWPWEETPRSVAHGILDDETYDWHAVVSGMIESGGYPVVVDELALERAHTLARSRTGCVPSHTGAAGLAGLLALLERGAVGAGESVAVIFSGVER